MMRLLLLCLLLPTATAYSEDLNGSGDGSDDEDLYRATKVGDSLAIPDKSSGEDSESDQITLTIIVVAVVVVALSVAAIIGFILVRRHKNKHQQGIYTVPIDQDKKEAV